MRDPDSEDISELIGAGSAVFEAGPDAAGIWLRLMRNNDPRKALDHCSGSAVWSDNGRQACLIPFWIDGPGAPENSNK